MHNFRELILDIISENLLWVFTLFWGIKQFMIYEAKSNFFTFLTVMLLVTASETTLCCGPSKVLLLFLSIKGFKTKSSKMTESTIASI